jgi:hypothetical protein
MMRRGDWKESLVGYLAEAARKPFAFGRHDCALFAAGAVAAMTGVDLAADWRGRYRTERGGLRMLRAAGYRDHAEFAAAHFSEVPVAMAWPGDLAQLDLGAVPVLGVVQGAGIYVLRPEGIATVPLLRAVRAWRVE